MQLADEAKLIQPYVPLQAPNAKDGVHGSDEDLGHAGQEPVRHGADSVAESDGRDSLRRSD